MKRHYPLDPQSLLEDGYYSKGHHDPKAFAEAVLAEHETCIDPKRVKHRWVRTRPALPHEREDYGNCSFFEDAKQGNRGVFPITTTY